MHVLQSSISVALIRINDQFFALFINLSRLSSSYSHAFHFRFAIGTMYKTVSDKCFFMKYIDV